MQKNHLQKVKGFSKGYIVLLHKIIEIAFTLILNIMNFDFQSGLGNVERKR